MNKVLKIVYHLLITKLDKLKEEALNVNKILGKCENVSFLL